MGIMVHSSLCVMQDSYHQLYVLPGTTQNPCSVAQVAPPQARPMSQVVGYHARKASSVCTCTYDVVSYIIYMCVFFIIQI